MHIVQKVVLLSFAYFSWKFPSPGCGPTRRGLRWRCTVSSTFSQTWSGLPTGGRRRRNASRQRPARSSRGSPATAVPPLGCFAPSRARRRPAASGRQRTRRSIPPPFSPASVHLRAAPRVESKNRFKIKTAFMGFSRLFFRTFGRKLRFLPKLGSIFPSGTQIFRNFQMVTLHN